MRTKIYLGVVLVFLLSLFAAAAEPAWTAQWVGPEKSATNTWTCFRKTIDLANVPATAMARIAVDSKYWLWINGKLVVFEGGLKRGPTPTGTYFDEIDLAPHLVKGPNTIAVLAWFFGKHGFSHNSSGKAGFLFEADIGGTKIISDKSWKMKIHPAYGMAGGPPPNYRLAEASIRFDARADMPGWNAPGFDDSSWSAATGAGVPPCAPWGILEARPIPFWKDYGLKDYVNATELPKVSDGKVIRAKLPYNAQVTPYLEVESAAGGETIDIRTDDFMGGGSPSVHAEYVTRGGAQAYETFGWMNGHEVHYTIPAGVKIKSLKFRETGFNAEFAGSFTCDDEQLNTLWKKAARTLYVTMRDNYMDCPDRERGQWWGDAVNELGESFYVFDPPAYSLTKKAMLELARWQRPDGTLYSPVPSGRQPDNGPRGDPRDGTYNVELPPQMLASVGTYGFWTYYEYTGDSNTIRRVYPAVKKYLNVWKLDADGLVIHRKGDWDWEDWGKNIDAPVLDNAWYYLALQAAICYAQDCGAYADVNEWGTRSKSIAEAFNKKFWNGKEYRSPSYTGDTDDRANAMAVCADLVCDCPSNRIALLEVFSKHHNAGPYMEKYVLEALCRLGAPGQAIERTKQRYADQISSPLTTLWEGWGIGSKGFGGGTYNHAWSGGPLTMLSRQIAGVWPLAPGYQKYFVSPTMGTLKTIHAIVPTIKGPITLSLQKEAGRFALDLNSPAGTEAFVCIPKPSGKQISVLEVNGTLFNFRKNDQRSDGVKFCKDFDDTTRFSVPPGTWKFVAEFK